MNLKVGIVGLPNAGKSTLFNALLKKQIADVAPYPFCTIEPNVGVVAVPDERLVKLQELVRSENWGQASGNLRPDPSYRSDPILPPLVPAVVEFVDIAGLVKGASEGQGLGNKFLSHIREVDIICHVVRYFPDPLVIHVAGEVDATRDKEIIETELILADLQTLAKQIEPKGAADKTAKARWEIIKQLIESLNKGKLARDVVVDPQERELVRELQLLTMKPMLPVGNVSESQLTSDVIPAQAGIQSSEKWIPDQVGNDILNISAKTEAELAALFPDEQKAYLKELGLEASGLDRLIQKAYEMLGLISFLTQGVKEVRAWTVEKGMKAPQAAGVIHTDFEKKFIKAEVIGFEELVAIGGWKKAKELGKVRFEGKEYTVKDGDVIEYKVGT